MLAVSSMLSTSMAAPVAAGAPVVPQMWTANVNQTAWGTMPIPPELQDVQFKRMYDYENKMEKLIHVGGKHDGENVVYRWDKTQPGEVWSQAYAWTPGKESLCCYVDLCTSQPCQMGNQERMTKMEVDSKATDMGPVGAHGEHWFKDMSIKVLKLGNLNDWTVDTSNSFAITNWTSNASVPKMGWEHQQVIMTNITVGGLTADDFTYPKFCNVHMCDSDHAESLRKRTPFGNGYSLD